MTSILHAAGTFTLLGVVFGVLGFAIWNARDRYLASKQAHELSVLKFQADTKLSALQEQILDRHYVPEMEIIFAHALMFGDRPEYLDTLEDFRARYPRAYALWTRHRGMDSTMDMHVRSNEVLGFIQP